MAAYDFSDLTETQQRLLTFGGWSPDQHNGTRRPVAGTVRKLIERGLLVHRQYRHRLGVMVDAWGVPLEAHRAWCEHCSKLEEAKEA